MTVFTKPQYGSWWLHTLMCYWYSAVTDLRILPRQTAVLHCAADCGGPMSNWLLLSCRWYSSLKPSRANLSKSVCLSVCLCVRRRDCSQWKLTPPPGLYWDRPSLALPWSSPSITLRRWRCARGQSGVASEVATPVPTPRSPCYVDPRMSTSASLSLLNIDCWCSAYQVSTLCCSTLISESMQKARYHTPSVALAPLTMIYRATYAVQQSPRQRSSGVWFLLLS